MSVTEKFLDRVAARVKGAEWISILLPFIIQALQAFLEYCNQAEDVANGALEPSQRDKTRLRRKMLVSLWGSGELNVWQAIVSSRQIADGILAEAQESAAKPEGQSEIAEMFTELKRAA